MKMGHIEYDTTTYGIVDRAEIAAGDISVKHRKDVDVPMFGSLCFICKDIGSVDILVNYLQNSMGFELTYKEYSCGSLTSKNNERIDVWAIVDFEKMRGYKYQAIFIQDDIYDRVLANNVAVHALWVNELIPPIKPLVFRLPGAEGVKYD